MMKPTKKALELAKKLKRAREKKAKRKNQKTQEIIKCLRELVCPYCANRTIKEEGVFSMSMSEYHKCKNCNKYFVVLHITEEGYDLCREIKKADSEFNYMKTVFERSKLIETEKISWWDKILGR
jgi:transposase-like protein